MPRILPISDIRNLLSLISYEHFLLLTSVASGASRFLVLFYSQGGDNPLHRKIKQTKKILHQFKRNKASYFSPHFKIYTTELSKPFPLAISRNV